MSRRPKNRNPRHRRGVAPSSRAACAPRPVITLDVDRLALGGEGVGRHERKVVFVEGALPGEHVVAEVIEERKRFSRAVVAEILEPSPERRPDLCTHGVEQGCGGCGMRIATPSSVLAWKSEAALGEMRKLAPDVDWPEPECVGIESSDESRTRMRLHVRGRRLGLYQRGSRRVVEIPDCLVGTPSLLRAVQALMDVVREADPEDQPREVTVDVADGLAFVVWQGQRGQGPREALGELVSSGVLAGVRLGLGDDAVLGEEWLREPFELGGHSVVLVRRAGSFGQATPQANDAIRRRLYHWLVAVSPERVSDLYAGSGNLSLVAALASREVVAVEVMPDGVEGMARSAAASSLDNVRVVEADLASGIPEEMRDALGDVVILDPPRGGAREIAEELREVGPPTIVYVSCAPATLARDVQTLAFSYRVAELVAVDMFPRTPHLEMMARLVRR